MMKWLCLCGLLAASLWAAEPPAETRTPTPASASPALTDEAAEARTVTASGLTVTLHGVSDDPWPFVKAEVEQQLGLAGDSQVSGPLADDLAFFTTQSYRRLGYPDARIDWALANGTVVLTVAEGVPKFVGEITITGTSVPDPDVEIMQEYVLRPTRERLGRTPKRTPFVAAELSAGSGLVVRYLQSLGYLRAEFVSMETPPGALPDAMDVQIAIKEGPRSVFGPVRWTGDLAGADKEIHEQGEPGEGEPFSEVRVESLRKAALTVLQSRGHFGALVTADYQTRPRGGPVPVTLHVIPGPVFTIGKVEIDPALSRGARRIARSAFRSERGKRYSPAALELPHRQAVGSGVFSRLEVQPVVSGNDELTLHIVGAEEPRKTLSLLGGYETIQSPILGAEWRQVNVLDTGDGIRLRVEANATGFNGSIGFNAPVFLGSRFTWDLQAAAQTNTYFDYDVRALTLRSGWARPLTRNIRTTLNAGYLGGTASSGPLTPEELGPDSYGYGTLGATLLLDYRDSPVLPTRGWMASVALEGGWGVNGAGNYMKSDFLLAAYWPLTSKWRIAGAARHVALHTADGIESLPIDLRLYNGGATSVRSYAEREMGAHSRSGTPLGGLSATTANLELSYEVITNLELAGFLDAGTLDREDSGWFPTSANWHYALGLGLRYRLPFGPLRVDYGYNPAPAEGEDRGALHITFGFAF